MLVPFSYNLRSLFVRRSSTLLTVLGIAATVAVLASMLALQQGFATLYSEHGRTDIAVFLRPGAPNEGASQFTRERGMKLIKSLPEIATGADGRQLAAMECFFAVRRFKADGGETNVPIRGVEAQSITIRGGDFRIVEGRNFTPGTDEVIVGKKLVDRLADTSVGDEFKLDVVPFRVVGIFECEGPYASEIWGDFDRMLVALERPGPNRVVAQLKYGTDFASLADRMRDEKEFPARLVTERDYLTSQTEMLSGVLVFLGYFLGVIMGVGAIFTATNTMLAAIASRSHEIGILLSTGFRPVPIFLSFLFEALMLGLLGGLVGCLLTLPLNGVNTGTTNWQTFTEVAFAFRVTPPVMAQAVIFSLVLGSIGGALPAWRAARMKPTDALRRA